MSESLYPIVVEVNGSRHISHVTARTSLVDWLREHLHLTGFRLGEVNVHTNAFGNRWCGDLPAVPARNGANALSAT